MTMPKELMSAEVIFLNRDDVEPAITQLSACGLQSERLDWVDPHSDETRWIMARMLIELSQEDFFDWVGNLVEPLGGDVVEAGLQSNERQS